MLSALLGDGSDLAPLRRVIIEKTEGNPFFMEETVQVLLDEGALVRNGATRLIRPISELKIPPSSAGDPCRTHRSAPARREVTCRKTLSVIGRELPMSLM